MLFNEAERLRVLQGQRLRSLKVALTELPPSNRGSGCSTTESMKLGSAQRVARERMRGPIVRERARQTYGEWSVLVCVVSMAFPPIHNTTEMANYVRETCIWHWKSTSRPLHPLPEDFHVLRPHFSLAEAEGAAVEFELPEIVQAMFYAMLLNDAFKLGMAHEYTAESIKSSLVHVHVLLKHYLLYIMSSSCSSSRDVPEGLAGPKWRVTTRNSPTSRLLLMAEWWLKSPERISIGSRKRLPMSFPFLSWRLPRGPAASILPPLDGKDEVYSAHPVTERVAGRGQTSLTQRPKWPPLVLALLLGRANPTPLLGIPRGARRRRGASTSSSSLEASLGPDDSVLKHKGRIPLVTEIVAEGSEFHGAPTRSDSHDATCELCGLTCSARAFSLVRTIQKFPKETGDLEWCCFNNRPGFMTAIEKKSKVKYRKYNFLFLHREPGWGDVPNWDEGKPVWNPFGEHTVDEQYQTRAGLTVFEIEDTTPKQVAADAERRRQEERQLLDAQQAKKAPSLIPRGKRPHVSLPVRKKQRIEGEPGEVGTSAPSQVGEARADRPAGHQPGSQSSGERTPTR
ncbi:LOW QUALITY PROTEIN: hypothetical protein Cgig2_033777 [Carnegiea gigantea]|uniref:Uncharacterized protein n=1 Tax=Carnegiea gigantea TaxID=171969 RepID=A0A9Q1KEU0_9CARY|nr:LOW QUALITY PROTEIN: hypothetical protein Cgig2_033777 [Carnegiea gigantea]